MNFFDREWKGKNYRFYAQKDRHFLWIHFQGRTWLWNSKKTAPKKEKTRLKKQSLIKSALPGQIQKINVKKNERIKKGQSLLIMSAMKIEYDFKAEGSGQVEEVFCTPHQVVPVGQKLMKIKYF